MFIQTHKRYPTSLENIGIISWRLFVISSQNFSCELNYLRPHSLRNFSYLLLRFEVVLVVLYNAKKVSHSKTYISNVKLNHRQKNETIKILVFVFEQKNHRKLVLWRGFVQWIKIINLSKLSFGCYIHQSFVNFKNLVIVFWKI